MKRLCMILIWGLGILNIAAFILLIKTMDEREILSKGKLLKRKRKSVSLNQYSLSSLTLFLIGAIQPINWFK